MGGLDPIYKLIYILLYIYIFSVLNRYILDNSSNSLYRGWDLYIRPIRTLIIFSTGN